MSNRQNKKMTKKSHTKNIGNTQDIIRRPMQISDQTYTCVQSLELVGSIASSASVPTFIALGISLNGFDQDGSFSGLFDFYRFLECEFIFMPRVQTNVVNDGAFTAVQNVGVFHTVVDQNDGTALTTVAQALDYPSCKAWSAGAPASRLTQRFAPKALIGTAAATTVSPGSMWYSTAVSNQAWYGVKTAWTVTSAVFNIDLIIRVKMQFRNLR
jgi:hypothetical protein